MNEPDYLRAFVRESNRIEGITRAPTKKEMEAHRGLLALDRLSVGQIEDFVRVVANRSIRKYEGQNVRVGNHIAPAGGPHIIGALAAILERANRGHDGYEMHLAYETLHPFMDGNGRSGRAIWLWQMERGQDPWALKRGFLRTFYYQTLSASPQRSAPARAP